MTERRCTRFASAFNKASTTALFWLRVSALSFRNLAWRPAYAGNEWHIKCQCYTIRMGTLVMYGT
ncbi:hypothetical protein COCMIDRAFT_84004 [Bipolaris oryzae ATCC 44560]|uniref:Uncharacterized protein n=1 Tax=Bipolaris oryzae ATCC 44560 TaxID=930090 RepID=W6ZD87_COCMI|nr:uncharacterized protein COCMIDRAFT_84004 [Bipolaris oryzae ATCC 44560]EUC49762.1 hypothetical protein COCMIDRAFT_84004 [Bipolaris oryzae ATCC 44560]